MASVLKRAILSLRRRGWPRRRIARELDIDRATVTRRCEPRTSSQMQPMRPLTPAQPPASQMQPMRPSARRRFGAEAGEASTEAKGTSESEPTSTRLGRICAR